MTTVLRNRRKAVSPVIATVILIAVAVALGIAVAFWASGLTSSFSKYEKLGVSTQYAIIVPQSSTCQNVCWNITLGGQNTGSSDAVITQIQINGVPYQPSSNYKISYTTLTTTKSINSPPISIPVNSGQTFTIWFYLPSSPTSSPVSGATFADGQTIQVTLITAAGNNYPASIVLP